MTHSSLSSSPLPHAQVQPARPNSWRLFRGLRIHLSALLGTLFCVFYVITATLIYGLTERMSRDDVDAILRDTAQPLVTRVSTALNHGSFPTQFITLAKLSQMYPKVSAIVLRDAQGNVIASTAPSVTRTLPYDSAGTSALVTSEEVPSHGWYRVLTRRLTNPYKQTTGYLQVAINVDRDRLALAHLRHVLLLVGGIGMIFAAVAGFVLSKVSLRPAVRAWKLQEQFVADASHELRTPLTVMKLNLEVMNSTPEATIAENTQWIQSMEEEIHRLHRLTNQLLTLARSDAASTPLVHRPVNLYNLMCRAGEIFSVAAEAKGLALHLEPQLGEPQRGEAQMEDLFTVMGDEDKLYQLLTILVDNAIKYTEVGRIDVSMERRRQHVLMSVRDTGIGIDSPHLDRVFDRFYRTDAARTKGSGGTGLGLSIARAIAGAHRGKITVQSALGKGTTFLVSLPAAVRQR